ncbi:polyhydroxyalkanoic acid system family protein [Methylobacterium aquaticum]|uniref:Polyhydroxyalkanoic acid synthase n=1 Tax=Methylobacterium aquaticum TaxID=270351 RepID=A0A0J6SI38_9HYPH|nr:polyhydroxyalkanoic acid system family protein [Methylobacterium aquaticum]KMO34900.1 polyhydroxyalkanoic acid synthase [Methylobacterium aquaticum]
MAKPLVVVIPHQLGRAEARRRLENGIGQAKEMLHKAGLSMADATWTGDRLSFLVAAMNQRVDGDIDVEDDAVRVEVRMPLLLSLFAHKIQQIVSQNGTKLLTKQ